MIEGPEFHHSVRVSRVREGERVFLIDGQGGKYEALVERIERERAFLRVLGFELVTDIAKVDLAVAVISMPRLEMAVEKCTEIGARAILPFFCERCSWRRSSKEVSSKIDRLNRKVIAACKQCGRARFPMITEIVSFENMLNLISRYSASFLADAEGGPLRLPADFEGPALGIVGPEGGFSRIERDMMLSAGAVPVNLGKTTLRTETAAICLVHRLIAEIAG